MMHAVSTLRQTAFNDRDDFARSPLGEESRPQDIDVQYSWIFCPVTGTSRNASRDIKAECASRDAEMRTGAALAARNSQIGICRLDAPNLRNGLSASFARADAYLVGALLRDYPRSRYWENGKEAPACDLSAGEAVISHAARE